MKFLMNGLMDELIDGWK